MNALRTASATALQVFNSPTPTIDLTRSETPTPIVDAGGAVTWHPQKELISLSASGGDGVYYYEQDFALYWDGTLMQPGGNNLGAPYVSRLSQNEICKLLNTTEVSGFFEEPDDYNFPFDGLGRGNVTVNGWHANSSSAQILDSAVSGRPYYDTLFCRNCPIPSEQTIIHPGLANIYFLLQNYRPEKRQVAPVEKLHVTFSGTEKPANVKTWPLESISLAQLWKDCNKEYDCTDSGMVVEGAVAQEIIKKLHSGDVISEQIFNGYSTQITYEAIWPEVAEVPQDYTMTCHVSDGQYALLPLNRQQKFWYYAPGGRWAAERIEGENKMRVVNTSGYEKIYGYDEKSFGREKIQIFPRYWSADQQFFFVNILPENYRPGGVMDNAIGLQKIDVKNEKVSYLFIGSQGQSFAYNFSRSGKKIAYIRQEQPLKLAIVDAFSGDEKSALIASPSVPAGQYMEAGHIAWYDEDKVYFVATYEQDGTRKTSIFMVDPLNPAGMKVVYVADGELKIVDTGNYSDICPLTTGGDDVYSCDLRIDLKTGEVGP